MNCPYCLPTPVLPRRNLFLVAIAMFVITIITTFVVQPLVYKLLGIK